MRKKVKFKLPRRHSIEITVELINFSIKDRNDETKSDDLQDKKFLENDFPQSQEFLTTYGHCVRHKVDYFEYSQNYEKRIYPNSKDECFNGILQFIYNNSIYQYNTNELAFFFSDAKISAFSSQLPYHDILNIFDYTNTNTGFTVPIKREAYLGVVFKNIKINPFFYTIGLNYSQNNLYSFVFEGFDEYTEKWEILDERCNFYIGQHDDFYNFNTHKTNNSYSYFRIRQTCPGNNFWGFFLYGFDIFGKISLRDNPAQIPEDELDFNDGFEFVNFEKQLPF